MSKIRKYFIFLFLLNGLMHSKSVNALQNKVNNNEQVKIKVVFVIDSSISMLKQDKFRLSQMAARLFVDLADKDVEIGIVQFGLNGKVITAANSLEDYELYNKALNGDSEAKNYLKNKYKHLSSQDIRKKILKYNNTENQNELKAYFKQLRKRKKEFPQPTLTVNQKTKEELKKRIDETRAEVSGDIHQCTDYFSGIDKATRLFSDKTTSMERRFIIFLTDGKMDPNGYRKKYEDAVKKLSKEKLGEILKTYGLKDNKRQKSRRKRRWRNPQKPKLETYSDFMRFYTENEVPALDEFKEKTDKIKYKYKFCPTSSSGFYQKYKKYLNISHFGLLASRPSLEKTLNHKKIKLYVIGFGTDLQELFKAQSFGSISQKEINSKFLNCNYKKKLKIKNRAKREDKQLYASIVWLKKLACNAKGKITYAYKPTGIPGLFANIFASLKGYPIDSNPQIKCRGEQCNFKKISVDKGTKSIKTIVTYAGKNTPEIYIKGPEKKNPDVKFFENNKKEKAGYWFFEMNNPQAGKYNLQGGSQASKAVKAGESFALQTIKDVGLKLKCTGSPSSYVKDVYRYTEKQNENIKITCKLVAQNGKPIKSGNLDFYKKLYFKWQIKTSLQKLPAPVRVTWSNLSKVSENKELLKKKGFNVNKKDKLIKIYEKHNLQGKASLIPVNTDKVPTIEIIIPKTKLEQGDYNFETSLLHKKDELFQLGPFPFKFKILKVINFKPEWKIANFKLNAKKNFEHSLLQLSHRNKLEKVYFFDLDLSGISNLDKLKLVLTNTYQDCPKDFKGKKMIDGTVIPICIGKNHKSTSSGFININVAFKDWEQLKKQNIAFKGKIVLKTKNKNDILKLNRKSKWETKLNSQVDKWKWWQYLLEYKTILITALIGLFIIFLIIKRLTAAKFAKGLKFGFIKSNMAFRAKSIDNNKTFSNSIFEHKELRITASNDGNFKVDPPVKAVVENQVENKYVDKIRKNNFYKYKDMTFVIFNKKNRDKYREKFKELKKT